MCEGAPVARLALSRSSVVGCLRRLPAYEEAQKKEYCCVLRASAILRCYCDTVLYGMCAALLCNVGGASCMPVRVVRGCIQCDAHGCVMYVQRVVWLCSRGRYMAAQVMQYAYDRSYRRINMHDIKVREARVLGRYKLPHLVLV